MKMTKILLATLCLLGSFPSVYGSVRISPRIQNDLYSVCSRVRNRMSVPRKDLIVVFFLSPNSCELCSSEVNYGWSLASEAIHRNLRVFAFSVDDNEHDGNPQINLPHNISLLR